MSIPGLTISELKYFMGISSATYDTQLDFMMTTAEKQCEEYCDRTFHYEELNEYKSPRRAESYLLLNKWPIQSVVALTDDYANSNTVVNAWEYYTSDENDFGCGVLHLNVTGTSTTTVEFTVGQHKVAVCYIAGYTPSAPANLRKSIYQLVDYEWNKRGKTGINSISLGDWSVSYAGQGAVTAGLPDSVLQTWNMYRKWGLG